MTTAIDQSLAAFERCHDVLVTLHDLDGGLVGSYSIERSRHRHPICEDVKSHGGAAVCYFFEVTALRRRLHRWPNGRIHRCHAGLVEWMVPVPAADGTPRAVLFAGPRRWLGDAAPVEDEAQRILRDVRRLPPVTAAAAEDLLELLRMLAGRIALLSSDAAPLQRFDPRHRRQQLHALLHHHGHEPIDLGTIAERWGVSRSRASHLVREISGKSWRTLILEQRLSRACHLLRTTDLPLPEVAARSGFGDRVALGRAFSAHFQQSPGRWRRQQDS